MHLQKILSIEEEIKPTNEKWVCAIIGKKEANELLEKNIVDVPRHLKRVVKSGNALHVLIHRLHDKVDFDYECEKIIVDVPKHKPLTEKQFEISNDTWPCHNRIIKEVLPHFCPDICQSLRKYETICSGHAKFIDKNGVCIYENTDRDSMFGHAIFSGIEEISLNQGDYLCNGIDLYIYKEPCLSCAVALIHARINKVFFICARENGEFTVKKINYLKSINHRYNTYKVCH